MADPQAPSIPPEAPQDVKDFFDCKADKLVWKQGAVSWLKIGPFETQPKVSFEHGATPGTVTITASASGLKGTVTASVNADGQLTTSNPSALLAPFAEQINDSVKQINDWFKHKGKKLKPAVLKQGQVTLEKTPIAASAPQPTPPGAVVPPMPSPEQKPAPAPDSHKPPPATTADQPYGETNVVQPKLPTGEVFKKRGDAANNNGARRVLAAALVLGVVAVGLVVGASLFGPGGSPGATPTAAAVASGSAPPPAASQPSARASSPATPAPASPPRAASTRPEPVPTATPIPSPDSAARAAEAACRYLITDFLEALIAADGCTANGGMIADPLEDQFAQDGLPPPTTPGTVDMDQVYVALFGGSSYGQQIRDKCGTTLVGDVEVVCDPDLVPPADATAAVTFVHLSTPTLPDQLYTYGLYVRYDTTTPGAEAPDGFPLYIGNNAHLQFSAPLNAAGTGYDPPVFTDYRDNTGAYSNHIQVHGPDWFAFITFDDPLFVGPYVCQLSDDRHACDVPHQPLSPEEFADIAAWYFKVPAPQ